MTDELVELQADNSLMEELFAAGLEALVAARVRKAIEGEVATLMATSSTITMEQVDKKRGSIFMKATAVPGAHILPGCRKIQLKYGDLDLADVEVQSLTMEVNLRIASAMKYHAMVTGELAALPNESYIVRKQMVENWQAPLGSCWLKMVTRSRTRLSSLLGSSAIACADDITSMVGKEELLVC